MTAKEYLKQAYRLDHRINSDISELGRLREMSSGISSPGFGEKVQTSHSGDAPFVKCLERIYALEEKINNAIAANNEELLAFLRGNPMMERIETLTGFRWQQA